MANLTGDKINQIVASAAATLWCGIGSCGIGTQNFAPNVNFGTKITENDAGVDASVCDFAEVLVESTSWQVSNPGMTSNIPEITNTSVANQ